MKNYIITLSLLCLSVFSWAQSVKLEGLNEYLIKDMRHFTILNSKESRSERRYQAMILNEYARDLNRIVLHFDKFTKIVSLKVTVSEPGGKVIKRYSLKDCQDRAVDLNAVASESRVKYLDILRGQYPYVVDVEYHVDNKGSMFYPSWTPLGGEKQGVKESIFIVSDPQNVGFRFRNCHVGEPRKEPEEDGFRYTWEVRDLGSVVVEPFSGNQEEVRPVVFLAPKDFDMDGHKGNMESWESFGMWMNQLCEGRDDLKPEDVMELKKQCESLPTLRDKVRAVYQYVQKNTRYVSIQLGIGGWQPFSASYVHRNKYGDCKALSFYTRTLLATVGLPSYYTLVRAGRDADHVPVDFPTAYFNHVILTVPLERDTVWLECTSSIMPMGFMGTFTSDRNCLVIGENGGRLVHTRKYGEQDNIQTTVAHLQLSENGDASVKMCRTFLGLAIENDQFLWMLNRSEDEKRKWIQDYSGYGNLELKNYQVRSLTGDEVPTTGFEVNGNLKGFSTLSAGRLFITPLVFSNIDEIRLTAKERISPITVRYASVQVDTVDIILPEGYQVEGNFPQERLNNLYGEYRTSMSVEPGKVRVVRYFCLKGGTYPKTDYDSFKAFITRVQFVDRNRLVLVKKR